MMNPDNLKPKCNQYPILHDGQGILNWIDSCDNNLDKVNQECLDKLRGQALCLNLFQELLVENRIHKGASTSEILEKLNEYLESNQDKSPHRRGKGFRISTNTRQLLGNQIRNFSKKVTTTMYAEDIIYQCQEDSGETDEYPEPEDIHEDEVEELIREHKEGERSLNFYQSDGANWFALNSDLEKLDYTTLDIGQIRDLLGCPIFDVDAIVVEFTINSSCYENQFHTPTLFDSDFYYYHNIILKNQKYGLTIRASNLLPGVREVVLSNNPMPKDFNHKVHSNVKLTSGASHNDWQQKNNKIYKKVKNDICTDCGKRLMSNAKKSE